LVVHEPSDKKDAGIYTSGRHRSLDAAPLSGIVVDWDDM